MTDDMWMDRDISLPFNPPGLRGRFGYPGRCWKLSWRDRLAWRLFSLVGHHDHVSVVWKTFRFTRYSTSTVWTFPNESSAGAYRPEPESEPDDPREGFPTKKSW
jgi:hypothetical protein